MLSWLSGHKFFLVIKVYWMEEGSTLMSGAFFLSGHNAGHQGELQALRDRGLGSDEMFLAMMARGNRMVNRG